MPIIRADGFGVITWHFNVVGSDGDSVVTLGYQSSSDNVDTLAGKAFAALGVHVMSLLSAHCILRRVTTLMQLSGNLESGESFGEGEVPGGATVSMLPANVALLVQKRTNFAGRKNRGRFYFPGVPADAVQLNVNGNVITEDHRAALQTAMDAFYDELKSSTLDDPINPMILHPVGTATSTVVTAFAVQTLLATQRGRLRN